MTQTNEQTTLDIVTEQINAIRNTDQTDTIGRTCSLDIDSDGTLTLSTQHPDENGTSMAIYNGLTLSFGLPMGVCPSALADWMDYRIDELRTVVDGMGSNWDGSNMRGTLTDAASDIVSAWQGHDSGESTLDFLASVTEWEPSEWLSPVSGDIARQPTIEAAVAYAIGDLAEDGLWTDDGVTHYISRDGCEAVAREWWTEAQPEADNE